MAKTVRDTKGKWVKGHRPEGAGRPKEEPDIVSAARRAGPRAIERLEELIESDDERIAAYASNAVLDRGFGKSRQVVDTRIEHDVSAQYLTAMQNLARLARSSKTIELEAQTVKPKLKLIEVVEEEVVNEKDAGEGEGPFEDLTLDTSFAHVYKGKTAFSFFKIFKPVNGLQNFDARASIKNLS